MLTIGKFQELFAKDGIELVAGHQKINQKIDYINVQEIDRKSSWTRKNGFVMTTFKDFEDVEQILTQLEWYLQMNISGVGFHTAIHKDTEVAQLIIEKAVQIDLPLFRIPSNIPYYYIFDKVNNYISEQSLSNQEELRKMREKMIHTILDEKDSKRIIHILGEYLDTPVIYLERSGKIKSLYSASYHEEEIKNILQRIKKSNEKAFGRRKIIENDNKVLKDHTNSPDSLSFTMHPLKNGMYFIGYLLVGNKTDCPYYNLAIKHTINTLLLHERNSQVINQYLKNQDIIILEKLVEGHVTDDFEKEINFPIQSVKQLMIWDISDKLDMEEKYLLMDSLLQNVLDVYFLWIYKGRIICLFTEQVDQILEDELKGDNGGHIALSGVINEFSPVKIKKIYDQAIIVLKYLKESDSTYSTWEDLSFNRIVYYLNDKLIYEDYGDLITPLIKKDFEDDTDLVKSLYVYLKCFFSYKDAAEILYVHPNTVKYRIEQARTLLGHVDFRDHQVYLDFMMALKLYYSAKK